MKKTLLLMFATWVGLWLAACSAAATVEPEAFVYPQSTADDGTMEAFRQQLEAAEKASLTGYYVELKMFTTDSSLEEVMDYYDNMLRGWKQVEMTENAQGSGMTLVKWTDNRQVFMIMYGEDPLGSGKTALYTERVYQE